MLNSDLSQAAPQGGRKPPTDKTRVVSTRRRVPINWVSGRTLQPSIESVVANSFVPSDFLVDDQVSGLGTAHPLLTLSFFSAWILPLLQEKVIVIRNGWTPRRDLFSFSHLNLKAFVKTYLIKW